MTQETDICAKIETFKLVIVALVNLKIVYGHFEKDCAMYSCRNLRGNVLIFQNCNVYLKRVAVGNIISGIYACPAIMTEVKLMPL